MALTNWRERQLTFTGGTSPVVLQGLPVGTAVIVYGCRVNTAFSGVTTCLLQESGGATTLMTTADVGATVAGLKRNTTNIATAPFLIVTAGSLQVSHSGLTGSGSITFEVALAKVDPGAGEI